MRYGVREDAYRPEEDEDEEEAYDENEYAEGTVEDENAEE